jgi:hypothetical protein
VRTSALALLLAALGGAGCTTEVVSLSLPETTGGLARYAHYTCCDPQGGKPCTSGILGSEASCKDIGIWKASVSDGCAAQGLVLTEYSIHGACGSMDDAGAAIAN